MRVISRSEVPDDYKEMLEKESHHNHEIIVDEHGTIRWRKNKFIDDSLFGESARLDLNDVVILFQRLGCGKNSEIYRKLYRCLGVSLSMYQDVFYWEANNEDTKDYIPNAIPL